MKKMLFIVSIFFILHSSFSISAAAIPPALLPQTGQTLCYNTAGTVITCNDTGQDGELQMGVPWPNLRFDDNSDQTVNDKLTGLIWTKDANLMKTRDPSFDADSEVGDGRVTWRYALDYIKKLNSENYLGHNDWRLPNVNELASLANKGQAIPATWLKGQGFSSVQPDYYWSGSTYGNYTYYAWHVYMGGGYVDYAVTSNFYYVWPVRSEKSGAFGSLTLSKTGQTICDDASGAVISCSGTGQDSELQSGAAWPSPRFADNSDQTVTDNLTGLVWSKDGNPAAGTKNWQSALDYIKSLNNSNYLKHNDWRLPNVNELASLTNKGQYNSATWLKGQGFSNVQSDNYWSDSTVSNRSDGTWYVDMDGGAVYGENKSSYYYVWPVRGGPLTLSLTTSGNGTISPDSGSISWSGSSGSASYNSGTTVNLTAIPTSGSAFSGWSGDCRGGSACTVTMDSAKSVSATFVLAATPINGSCGGSNGAVFTSTPTSSLCNSGSASTPIGSGPWYWSCSGIDGGSTTSCAAYIGSSSTTGATSKAKVYMGVDDLFYVGNSGLTIYGGSGNDTVTIAAGVTGVKLDQNVERINLPGAADSYAFKQTGNKLNIYDTTGTTLLVTVPVQGDADGTVLGFSDGSVSAMLTGGVMTVGGKTVSQ